MPHALTDHETIRRWADACGIVPAVAADQPRADRDVEIRLASRDDAPEDGMRLSWAAWFQRFDAADLALLIDDASRQPSTFNRLVPRASVASNLLDSADSE
jgi:hypothetical protein